MNLDSRQTRRLFLAGTVALPTPFPTVGTIYFDKGSLTYSAANRSCDKELVVIEHCIDRKSMVTCTVLREHVAALFVPGTKSGDGPFQNEAKYIDNDEEGEWFLDSDISEKAIRKRLDLAAEIDITSRKSKLKGIVFVHEKQPVICNSEVITTAEEINDLLPSVLITRASCLSLSTC